MSTKRLLGVFAHPDDEGLISGALLQYSASGVETGLVCATRGEVGEISDPALATPENLGEVREQEMRAAADVLGVRHLWFLGYRDSGMAGTPENQDPRSLAQASAAEVIGKLVAIIRQFRPQVMVTFDETGGYGHPDHIAIYRYTTGAFHAAADGAQYPELGLPHAVSKLYYSSFARRHILMLAEWLQTGDPDSPYAHLDPERLGIPDDQISVLLDVERWNEVKDRSWAMHRTQMDPNSALAHVPEEVQRRWRSTEVYQLAASRVGPDVVGENDLFARIP
ncbi:MAG TPA: PIG-L family deacetylase [Ktedonobacteraceae bacterium]|jgi:LmbE family N-acetylglucosaminyl deacetylase|nr:PIG-L family deacetylase [Ktedonobacteraceae bacterium]